jgi:hypothetical protein
MGLVAAFSSNMVTQCIASRRLPAGRPKGGKRLGEGWRWPEAEDTLHPSLHPFGSGLRSCYSEVLQVAPDIALVK